MSARVVLVLQGPNLDLLGTREPDVYGTTTLADIQARLDVVAAELGVRLEHFQSAHEGALVERVHDAAKAGAVGAIVNAAAYTHTSVALRDAFLATRLPFVEVHLSNVFAREKFRHESLLADVAVGLVCGLGPIGYELALRGLLVDRD
jgi:3-dehydroquinate dehydratase-2